MKTLLICLMVVFVNGACAADPGEPLIFIKSYIETINNESTPIQYKMYWTDEIQNTVFTDATRLDRAHKAAVKNHYLVVSDGALENLVYSDTDGDKKHFHFEFNSPVAVSSELKFTNGIKAYDKYQVGIIKEEGQWKLTSENMVGSK